MVFGGTKLDRDDRSVQPIGNDGGAGQDADPPYRAGTLSLQQHLQRALPLTQNLPVWAEVRVRPKPGAAAQVPPALSRPQADPVISRPLDSKYGSLSTSSSPKPQSYVDALQSDPKAKVSSYSSGLSSATGLSRAGISPTVSATNSPRPTTSAGSYGLGSEVRQSTSTSALQKPAAKPKEDSYGLFDEELEMPRGSAATTRPSSLASSGVGAGLMKYGRASPADGPSTPRSSSPSGSQEGVSRPSSLAMGGASAALGRPPTAAAAGSASYKPAASSSLYSKSYY